MLFAIGLDPIVEHVSAMGHNAFVAAKFLIPIATVHSIIGASGTNALLDRLRQLLLLHMRLVGGHCGIGRTAGGLLLLMLLLLLLLRCGLLQMLLV